MSVFRKPPKLVIMLTQRFISMFDNVQNNEPVNSIFVFQYNVQFHHDLNGSFAVSVNVKY